MPYKTIWLDKQEIRASAVLTDAYVATTKQEIVDVNQLVLYVDFTIGSLTSAEMKIEFSNDDSSWFQEASQVSGGSGLFTLNPLVRKFDATGKKRIAIPVTDRYVRVSVKGTGTVTDSLMAIELQLGSSA